MQYGQYQGVSFSGSSGNINNTDPNEIIRKIEKRSLRRTSTELGFFILFYFLMMTESERHIKQLYFRIGSRDSRTAGF